MITRSFRKRFLTPPCNSSTCTKGIPIEPGRTASPARTTAFFGVKRGGAGMVLMGETPCAVGEVSEGQVSANGSQDVRYLPGCGISLCRPRILRQGTSGFLQNGIGGTLTRWKEIK